MSSLRIRAILESTRRYACDIHERVIAISDPARKFAQNWKSKGVPPAFVTDDSGKIREKGNASSPRREPSRPDP